MRPELHTADRHAPVAPRITTGEDDSLRMESANHAKQQRTDP